MKCYQCQTELEDSNFGRQDTCPKCRFSTHCCRNCIHFDSSRYNECTEPVADRVVDKEKFNFCDYFKAGYNEKNRGVSGPSAAELARIKAEALFKKK